MSLEPLGTDMPITEDFTVKIPLALRGKIRARAIYDTAVTRDPAAAATLDRSVAAGEEARLLEEIPMKMQMADESVAMLGLAGTGSGGALLIRGSVPVLPALRSYFEMLWERAFPVGCSKPPSGSPLTKVQHHVLRLLAQGEPDKSIARALGISESTVARHINVITTNLNARSRFAAGVAAARHGWLGPDDLHSRGA